MNRSLFRIATYLQLGIVILMATGCTPTQPFFLHESPDLQYYLNTATRVEYPDVDVKSLPGVRQTEQPLAIGNHDYKFWNLTLEECVSMALDNAKFFVTTSGNAEFRQNVAAQFTSASPETLGSIYDVAIGQSTTQAVPLTVDGAGNRVLPRGVLRANQIGGVEDALAEFDAQVSGFLNYSTTDRVNNSNTTAINNTYFRAYDTTQQLAISKRYATGGVGTLRQQIIYSRNNNTIRLWPSDWTALIEAQVQHPLMRNRGTMVNRIPVVLASLNEDISIADFEMQVRNLVRDVEVAYWNLYIAYRNVATTTVGRNSAIATAKFAGLNLEEGTGTIQELAQANEQYYRFRGQLEAALSGSNLPGDDRFGVYGGERTLREVIGIDPTDGRLIRPIDEPTLARVEFDWDESVAQMLYLSPELRRARFVIKQRELELVSAKNQILPELNLSFLYRWVGVGDQLGPPNGRPVSRPPALPSAGSSALSELTSGNYQELAARLEFTPPAVGGRRERARIRGSKLQIERAKSFLQEAERLMVSQLSDAVAKAKTHYRLVQTNAQRWQQAEIEVQARLAEFKGGRSPVNVVLQSQERKAAAEIQYYRALGEYNKSLNYVDYLKGTELANANITISEGPWNKKAYWDALERARERSAGKKKKYGVTRPGVVRLGPVLGPEAAAQMKDGEFFGSGAELHGDAILEGPMSGFEMGAPREPIQIDGQPIGEMGETPREMYGDPGPVELVPPPAQTEDGSPDSQTLPPPIGPQQVPPSETEVQPTGHQAEIETDAPLEPVRRKPPPTIQSEPANADSPPVS